MTPEELEAARRERAAMLAILEDAHRRIDAMIERLKKRAESVKLRLVQNGHQ